MQLGGQDLGKEWGGEKRGLVLVARKQSLICMCVCVATLSLMLPPFAATHLSSICRLFIDGDRIDAPSVKEHLLLDLGLEAEYRIQVHPYKSILSELKALCADLSPREKVWVSDKASYAVSEAIPKVGDPTLVHLNSATPFPVLVLSLEQRQTSEAACWIRTVVSLDEALELEPYQEPEGPYCLLSLVFSRAWHERLF